MLSLLVTQQVIHCTGAKNIEGYTKRVSINGLDVEKELLGLKEILSGFDQHRILPLLSQIGPCGSSLDCDSCKGAETLGCGSLTIYSKDQQVLLAGMVSDPMLQGCNSALSGGQI